MLPAQRGKSTVVVLAKLLLHVCFVIDDVCWLDNKKIVQGCPTEVGVVRGPGKVVGPVDCEYGGGSKRLCKKTHKEPRLLTRSSVDRQYLQRMRGWHRVVVRA